MRLHVVGLPHTQTTRAYSTCAYTEKVRKFCTMMAERGDTVFLYAGEENEAKCAEHVPCIYKEEQATFGFNGPQDYLSIDFNAVEPWSLFHRRAKMEIARRLQPGDIICVITGIPTFSFKGEFAGTPVVEFGVGYTGICHDFRVFESHAWRNYVYGTKVMDGAFFDEVIPNYWETKDFPFGKGDGGYFLYIGRLTEKKGWRIAQDVCERMGKRFMVAGPGEFSGYGEYVGTVGPEDRAKLMGGATAVFVPTLYVPPFEGVHIEANLCGTPVITTDFGVFTETVRNYDNGVRCKMFADFIEAAHWAEAGVDRVGIHYDAATAYSTQKIAEQYAAYFKRLSTLAENGWYAGVPS